MSLRILPVIAFAAAFAVVAGVVGAFVPWPEHDELAARVAWFSDHRDEFELLYFGSSNFRLGLNPQQIDRRLSARRLLRGRRRLQRRRDRAAVHLRWRVVGRGRLGVQRRPMRGGGGLLPAGRFLLQPAHPGGVRERPRRRLRRRRHDLSRRSVLAARGLLRDGRRLH